MSIRTAAASPWPARAAYFSAAIFIAASGTTNVTYGFGKGDTLATSLVWAGVAGAVAIVFALAWPALIKSVDAKRWSAALIALVALLLAGSFSVTAALGSAAGGRANAATTETAIADVRKKAQDAYDAAKAELATLKLARPVAELEAIIGRSGPEAGGRCALHNGTGRLVCPPHPLAPELARAKRRAELEAKIEREASRLTNTGPARQANSDARTLARYLQALGANTTPEHLNDLLVLLAVLMIEAGGGLSLALGLALSAPPAARPKAPRTGECAETDLSRTPQPNAQTHALTERANTLDRTPDRPRPITVQPSGVVEWLAQQGGHVQTSRRRLATVLGRSPSSIHEELRRLAASGAITMTTGPRGTLLALRPN